MVTSDEASPCAGCGQDGLCLGSSAVRAAGHRGREVRRDAPPSGWPFAASRCCMLLVACDINPAEAGIAAVS